MLDREKILPLKDLPVNFHITRACNFSCGHCFATFRDAGQGWSAIKEEAQLRVVESLVRLGASKITFSGGEPLLVKWLPKLLTLAHGLGVTTCVVTNGSLVTRPWLSEASSILDWLTLSVDSLKRETNVAIGRVPRHLCGTSATSNVQALSEIVHYATFYDIGLRINTVVTKYNLNESFSDLIISAKPVRWKIMQAMSVAGQGQRPSDKWSVSDAAFRQFVDRHRNEIPGDITIVSEPSNLIRGSYIMVDPWGRLFESRSGRHKYLQPVGQVSVDTLGNAVDTNRLVERDGLWRWARHGAVS